MRNTKKEIKKERKKERKRERKEGGGFRVASGNLTREGLLCSHVKEAI